MTIQRIDKWTNTSLAAPEVELMKAHKQLILLLSQWTRDILFQGIGSCSPDYKVSGILIDQMLD